jgi:hypothetical protein
VALALYLICTLCKNGDHGRSLLKSDDFREYRRN